MEKALDSPCSLPPVWGLETHKGPLAMLTTFSLPEALTPPSCVFPVALGLTHMLTPPCSAEHPGIRNRICLLSYPEVHKSWGPFFSPGAEKLHTGFSAFPHLRFSPKKLLKLTGLGPPPRPYMKSPDGLYNRDSQAISALTRVCRYLLV